MAAGHWTDSKSKTKNLLQSDKNSKMFQNPIMGNMTKILYIRNQILEIETRRVSSIILKYRI